MPVTLQSRTLLSLLMMLLPSEVEIHQSAPECKADYPADYPADYGRFLARRGCSSGAGDSRRGGRPIGVYRRRVLRVVSRYGFAEQGYRVAQPLRPCACGLGTTLWASADNINDRLRDGVFAILKWELRLPLKSSCVEESKGRVITVAGCFVDVEVVLTAENEHVTVFVGATVVLYSTFGFAAPDVGGGVFVADCSGVDFDPVEGGHDEDVYVFDCIFLVPAAMNDYVEARVVRGGGESGAELGARTRNITSGEDGGPLLCGDVINLDAVHFAHENGGQDRLLPHAPYGD